MNPAFVTVCVVFFHLFSQWSIVNIVWVDVLDWFGAVFGTKSGKKIESRSKYNDQAQAQQLNQYRQSLCRSIVSSLLFFFQFVLMQFIYGILCCTFSSDVDINGWYCLYGIECHSDRSVILASKSWAKQNRTEQKNMCAHIKITTLVYGCAIKTAIPHK